MLKIFSPLFSGSAARVFLEDGWTDFENSIVSQNHIILEKDIQLSAKFGLFRFLVQKSKVVMQGIKSLTFKYFWNIQNRFSHLEKPSATEILKRGLRKNSNY